MTAQYLQWWYHGHHDRWPKKWSFNVWKLFVQFCMISSTIFSVCCDIHMNYEVWMHIYQFKSLDRFLASLRCLTVVWALITETCRSSQKIFSRRFIWYRNLSRLRRYIRICFGAHLINFVNFNHNNLKQFIPFQRTSRDVIVKKCSI